MDIEMRGRIYALELVTTQLISEYLRTVADPAGQVKWAADHLRRVADGLAVETDGLDEEARLRASIKDHVRRMLDTALMRAQTTPLRPPSYDTGPQAG
jgi:hypothetical protein